MEARDTDFLQLYEDSIQGNIQKSELIENGCPSYDRRANFGNWF